MIKQECIGIPDMILLLMIFCFKKIKIKAEIVLSPGGAYFPKKISQCRKKLKGGTLRDFSTSILSQNSKKIEGGTLWGIFFPKKIGVPKKIERGIVWSRSVLYDTRETFLVQFLGPAGTIWRRLKIL